MGTVQCRTKPAVSPRARLERAAAERSAPMAPSSLHLEESQTLLQMQYCRLRALPASGTISLSFRIRVWKNRKTGRFRDGNQ